MNSATNDGVSAESVSALPARQGWRLRPMRLSTLLSLLTLAVLSPLLFFNVYSLSVQSVNDRAAERDRLAVLALDLANAVDRELGGQIVTAQMLAASRSLQTGDLQEFWEQAEDAASQANGHFILIDANYQQVVNTDFPVGSPLPRSNNPRLVDAVLQGGAPLVTDLVSVAASGEALLYTVRVPVVIDGVVRYALSYVPRKGAMLDVVQQSYRPDDWRAVITDGAGLVIARSHRNVEFYGQPSPANVWDQAVGQSGIVSGFDLQGLASLSAYHVSDRSDWKVFIWAHESVLEAPARAAQRKLLAWAVFAVAAALLAGWLAGRLIQRPTRDLVTAAHEMANGKTVDSQLSLMQEANLISKEIAAASQTIAARAASIRQSEEQMRVVMRELSHRSLNLLTVVQLIAKQSGRHARDFKEFMDGYQDRITGLARSHDLLVTTDWTSVPLKELVTTQLSPFVPMPSDRIAVDGPMIMLRSEAVQSFGMGIHELATNAIKHGALSVPDGRISVRWTVETDADGVRRLLFRWQESGGPEITTTDRSGFGLVVTDRLVPAGIEGTARTELHREGLVWQLDVPLARLVSES
jgi:two-component sensor histidine kinase